MANRETKLQIVIDAQNKTQSAFNSLKSNLDAVKKSHEGLISAMRTTGIVGTAAFAGLSLATKGIIQAGAAYEQTQIAFETMIGDAELAQKTLGDLANFAKKTPFEITQLEEASKRLLAYGVDASSLIPTLRMLGDISAGVGMDKLPQLILAFGQVRAATKLTGMELRQFSEAGVPLLGTLATMLGKTEGEIMEMVSVGEIGFPLVQEALASLTGEGGKFFNLMERQSTSLGGMWSNFKDSVSLTARAMGEEFLPYLKPVVEKLIELTQIVGRFVEENPKLATAILVGALAFTGLLAVLLPISLMLPGLILMWGGLAAAVSFFVAGPGVLVVAAILGIIAVIIQVSRIIKILHNDWDMVWLGIKTIAAESTNAVIGFVEKMINFIISGVNKAIEAINKVIRAAQKVPGIGSNLSTIRKIDSVDLGRIDTGTIASNQLNKSQSGSSPIVVNVTGNTLLDQYSATTIGDLIMQRLKTSNAL